MPAVSIPSGDVTLRAHVAAPPAAAGRRGARPGVILCHGFPLAAHGPAADPTYPSLADRIAANCASFAVVPSLRGVGGSEGGFSPRGWLDDIRATIEWLVAEHAVASVWLAGFGSGGTLCVSVAAADERVAGVAALGSPVDLTGWGDTAAAVLDRARRARVLAEDAVPADLDDWPAQLAEVSALRSAPAIPPRPLLLVHGSDDDAAPAVDARALSDAAAGRAELRIITSGGHRLRHDPRAIAILLGWLDRHTH